MYPNWPIRKFGELTTEGDFVKRPHRTPTVLPREVPNNKEAYIETATRLCGKRLPIVRDVSPKLSGACDAGSLIPRTVTGWGWKHASKLFTRAVPRGAQSCSESGRTTSI